MAKKRKKINTVSGAIIDIIKDPGKNLDKMVTNKPQMTATPKKIVKPVQETKKMTATQTQEPRKTFVDRLMDRARESKLAQGDLGQYVKKSIETTGEKKKK